MRKTILASLALVLSSTVYAQTTLPLGYEKTDGGWYSYYIGYWPDAHIQILTGSLQGTNKAQPWRRLSLRRSQTVAGTNSARTWTNVQLDVGDMDSRLVRVTTDCRGINNKGAPVGAENKQISLYVDCAFSEDHFAIGNQAGVALQRCPPC